MDPAVKANATKGTHARHRIPKTPPQDLLDENEVVSRIRAFLERDGYSIQSICNTGETGTDICAIHAERDEKLVVECKGQTSSKQGTGRYGAEFSTSMVWHSVAQAVYTAMVGLPSQTSVLPSGSRQSHRVAIGFPDSPTYRWYVMPIKAKMDLLKITVFMVQNNGTVTVL